MALHKLSGTNFTATQEFNASDNPTSMLWAGTNLLLCSRRSYSLLHVGSGVQSDILAGGSSLSGMALLPTGELLLTRDLVSYFFTAEGGCSAAGCWELHF